MHYQSSAKCVLCCILRVLLNGPGGLRAVLAVNNAIVLLTTDMSTCLDLHAVLCCPFTWMYLLCSAVPCCAVLGWAGLGWAAHAVRSA